MTSNLKNGLAQQMRAFVQIADRVDHVRHGVPDSASPPLMCCAAARRPQTAEGRTWEATRSVGRALSPREPPE